MPMHSLLKSLRSPKPQSISLIKAALFVLALGPLAWLLWQGFYGDLGANPVETITHETGQWCLRFLLITLLVTPVRKLSGWHWVVRLRRMLGLYAFFYGCLHFLTYLWFDQDFALSAMLKDVIKRPFITVGFAALLLMLPLALTSFNAAMRWLGGKRWQLLHRLIYVIAILGVIHFWWLVKSDITEPLTYALLLAPLLLLRLWWAYGENWRVRLRLSNKGP